MAAADHILGDLDYSAATTSGGRVTVLPDSEGGSSATDIVGSNGPTLSTANGSTIGVYADSQHLDWPIQSGVNASTTKKGFALWVRPAEVTSEFQSLVTAWTDGSASAEHFGIDVNFAGMLVYLTSSADITFPSVFSVSTWTFVYVHYDGSQAAANRVRAWTVDTSGTVTELSGSINGTLPSTLNTATGAYLLGAFSGADSDAYNGDVGQHLWALDDLLTEQEIQELAAVDAPVVLGVASGSAALPTFGLSGTATAVTTREASGSAALPTFGASGSASVAVQAAGAAALPAFELSGAASVAVQASGSLALPTFQLSGTAGLPELQASGSLALPTLQVAGSATVPVQASGALVLPSFGVSGAAARQSFTTGALALPGLSASGSAVVVQGAEGELRVRARELKTVTSAASLAHRCGPRLAVGASILAGTQLPALALPRTRPVATVTTTTRT